MTDLVAGAVASDPVQARSGDALDALRTEVRDFCESARLAGEFVPRCDAWLASSSPEFSRALARKGWVGMTWPRRYGGHGRSAVERLVVAEELLAAGAPVASTGWPTASGSDRSTAMEPRRCVSASSPRSRVASATSRSG